LVAKELEKARLLMARWGLPAATLADGLQRMLGGHRFRLERVIAAITELEDALKRGKLHAYAIPGGRFTESASSAAEVPTEFFYTPAVSVWTNGELSIPTGNGYHDVQFRKTRLRAPDVERLWPPAGDLQAAPSAGQPQTQSRAVIENIFQKHFTCPEKRKYADAVRACATELSWAQHEVKAALPDMAPNRRSRGRPRGGRG
jgi:hypothetical protein